MSLSADQLRRMEANKAMALERKRIREEQSNNGANNTLNVERMEANRAVALERKRQRESLGISSSLLSQPSLSFSQQNQSPIPIETSSISCKKDTSISNRQSFPPSSDFRKSSASGQSVGKEWGTSLSAPPDIPQRSYEFTNQQQYRKGYEFSDKNDIQSMVPSTPESYSTSSSVEAWNSDIKVGQKFRVPTKQPQPLLEEETQTRASSITKTQLKPSKPSAFDVMMRTNSSALKNGGFVDMTTTNQQSSAGRGSRQMPNYFNLTSSPPLQPQPASKIHKAKALDSISKASAQTSKPAFSSWSKAPVKAKAASDGSISLSEEQLAVLNLAVSGESIFFTGNAGTGKSTLLKEIIRVLKDRLGGSSLAITASTGAAATLISGTTIHSFSGCGLAVESGKDLANKVTKNRNSKKRWTDISCLVIDEISMLDADLFDKLDTVAQVCRKSRRTFGGIQLILCGDFFQLPPVSKDKATKFCFESACWNSAISKSIVLRTVFRQKNQDFVNCLNECRNATLSQETIRLLSKAKDHKLIDPEPTRLCAFNNSADRTNQTRLSSLSGQSRKYEASDRGQEMFVQQLKKNSQAPTILELKIGAKVILLKNLDLDWGLCNGSRGTVVEFAKLPRTDEEGGGGGGGEEEEIPLIEFRRADGETMRRAISREEFNIELQGKTMATRTQLPLKLAWAISIHKSQGMTIDCLEVDLQGCFECGQAYVALSRATSFDQLRVLNFTPGLVKAHPKVAQFYSTLEKL